MKTKIIFATFMLLLTALPLVVAQQDEDVRGAFLTSRPKTSTRPAQRPSRRRPRTITATASASISTDQKSQQASGSVNLATSTNPRSPSPRIGVGLTLFMRDQNGVATRVDPSREFRRGDHVRVLMESNVDGYLYVFNTTDGGQPSMIYPDPDLDEGGNYVQGHVPFEIPSSLAAEERLRWFTFDQYPGVEKLYFVFSREPLPAVPIEDDLITYCRENAGKCPWRPAPAVWEIVKTQLNEPTRVAKSSTAGKTQTANERQAVTRGIGLNRDDPEPAVITLTTSTSKSLLVSTMDLTHKN